MELREFKPETDALGHRELFNLSFPETEGTSISSQGHYEWKFRNYPDDTPSYEYVAVLDGKVVGYYAAIPYTYLIGGEPKRVAMVCDVMTHPEVRGQGIFTKLGQYATSELRKEGLWCTTGFPIRPEVIPGHKKVGWKIVKPLPVFARPVRSRHLLPSVLSGLSLAIDPLLAFVRRIISGDVKKSDLSVLILDREAFLGQESWPSIQACIELSEGDREIRLAKSRKFIAWRTAAPGATYKFYVVKNGHGRVLAFAIARQCVLKGIPTLAVLDLVAVSGRPDCLKRLHALLGEAAWESKLALVAMMIDEFSAREFNLKRNGYIRTPAKFELIVKALAEGADPEAGAGSPWRTMWLDSDDL